MNSSLYSILLHAHSIGRWVILLLLVIAIFNSMVAGGRPFIKSDNTTGLLLTISADLMLLIGLVLWYFGPTAYQQIQARGMNTVMQDPIARFYAVEHITAMVIAIIFIHIGKAQAKKKIADNLKHRRTVIWYLLALIVILISIPWPFVQAGSGRGWF
jgi:predicted Na+-dependent transporter